MKKLILWILAIFGILFLLLIGLVMVGVYYSKNIDQIRVEKFDITNLKSISNNSFKISGNIYVNNPSRLSIPIKSIRYKIILNETSEEISSGETHPFKIEAGKTNKVSFEHQINLNKTIELLPKLLVKEKIPASLEASITIDLPILRNRPIPIKFEIDVKEYLKEFLNDQVPLVGEGLIQEVPYISGVITDI